MKLGCQLLIINSFKVANLQSSAEGEKNKGVFNRQ